ncbi:MAG: peptidylprolyl isomerase [Melioribacteraceae bacterium]|nr:peptidylprolyl isomerase [Melioribacteraceae bacterium]
MINKNPIKLIILFLFAANIMAQTSDVIVDLGFDKITAAEFKFRFETSPYIQTSKNIDSLKNEFLLTLIGEKLLANRARQSGFDKNDYVSYSAQIMEKYLIRDYIYKTEILDKISISDSSYRSGLYKSTRIYTVNFLHSFVKNEIDSLYNLLQSGADFDSLLQTRNERFEQEELIEVVYGQMTEELENIIFNLELSEYSKPSLTEKGWLIFYAKNIRKDFDEKVVSKRAKETLENRAVIEKQNEFYKIFIKGKTIDVDTKLFVEIVNHLHSIIQNKEIPEDGKTRLDYYDFRKVMREMGENKLKSPFVKFEIDPISLEYFLNDLGFNQLELAKTDSISVTNILSNYIRNFIQSEIIARIGYQRNIQQLPSIKNELKLWENYFSYSLYRNSFIDSVKISEQEIQREMEIADKFLNPKEVRVIEILTKNLESVEKILNKLEAGEDFEQLAQEYNERESTIPSGGAYDWFPITSHGEIGRIASTMNLGDVYGPINLSEGFSIIKLIDERESKDALAIDVETKKELTREKLFYSKLKEKLEDKTVTEALNTNMQINMDVLNSIKVTEVPAMVYRFYGFGGSTSAAPYLAPFYQWYQKYLKEIDAL